MKNDRLRITGKMECGGKVGVNGMIMKARNIENLNSGDIYEKI